MRPRRECASCQEKSVEEEESTAVQRQAATAAAGTPDEDIVPSDSAGEPLDVETRKFMEPRFGRDFSDVRVHTDAQAARSATALAADAYTTGRDIYFAAGKYAPSSRQGQHLVAHELAHTIQQDEGCGPAVISASAPGGVTVGRADDSLEYEAEEAADAALSPGLGRSPGNGTPMQLSRASRGIIQRKTNLATVLKPIPVAMTVGIDGITFEVPPEFSYVAGPKPLQLFALILGRLVGPQYTPELAEQVEAFFQKGGYEKQGALKGTALAKDGEKPDGAILKVSVYPSVALIDFLQKKKLTVQIDPEQAQTLFLGIENTKLWEDVKRLTKEVDLPLPAWYNEAFFTAEMSSQGALLRQYAAAQIQFKKTGDAEAQSQGRNVAIEILSQIVDATDVLEAIRKDTSVAKNDKAKDVYGRLFKLPDPVPDPLPVPAGINSFELATLFLGYVHTKEAGG